MTQGAAGVVRDRMAAMLEALGGRQVLCVGDLMLDVEVPCGGGRLSPEAPVLVFEEQHHRRRAGGAANVAANLAGLGVEAHLASVVGDDEEGALLGRLLDMPGVTATLVHLPADLHPTTRKTRFVADGRQLLRIDRERRSPIEDAVARQMIDRASGAMSRLDAVVISDYGKGAVTAETMAQLHLLARDAGVPMLVDPHGRDWARYGAVDLIKPNATELALATGMSCDTVPQVEAALEAALARCDAKAILVTRAEHGAALLERGAPSARHFAAQRVEVADVCGAGDTNLAALGAFLASSCALDDAINAAQQASAIAVRRRGNAIVTAADMLDRRGGAATHGGKLLDGTRLTAQLSRWRAAGLRIGFTNGCFDMVHAGHLHTLQFARAQCDRLIVGLNSDAAVRRLKGPERPLNNELDRATVLSGLEVVDAVAIFAEDRPDRLIEAVRPDILVKGGDYDPATVAGGDFVRSYGGRVIVSDLIPDRSTTRLVERIVQQRATGSSR